jgi:uncharacterized peroxidase-related enzyme
MPHITLPATQFGIRSLFAARPDTAAPLRALAEVLLRGPSPLPRGERELIAAYVSSLNKCAYCAQSHAAFAARQIVGGRALVEKVLAGNESDPQLSPKLIALLRIAEEVQRGGASVQDRTVAEARQRGAGDEEIHDTVLIAAAFCMFNRYVDGLATVVPDDPAIYEARAAQITELGYAAAAPTERE